MNSVAAVSAEFFFLLLLNDFWLWLSLDFNADLLLSQNLSFPSFVDLAGKTDLEELQVDMVIDCMEDILKPFFVMRRESDETRKVQNFVFLGVGERTVRTFLSFKSCCRPMSEILKLNTALSRCFLYSCHYSTACLLRDVTAVC